MPELSPELSAAPLPLLLLDPDNVIIAANGAAVTMGFEIGASINDYLHLQGRNVGAEIASAPGNKLWRLTFPDSEKHCYLSIHESESGVFCWLRDMSEQLAIADRLRQMKEPGGKQLRRINHLSSTALGYAELLDVIMEDPTSLAAEQQALVRHYQAEVRQALQSIQEIAVAESITGQSKKDAVLLVESHTALNELITELLKSEGYKVTSFLDAQSAIQYFRVNHHAVQAAIIEDDQGSADTLGLPGLLKDIAPALSIITLAADPDSVPGLAIRKPLDINQLLKLLRD